jgi:hypothetical protein
VGIRRVSEQYHLSIIQVSALIDFGVQIWDRLVGGLPRRAGRDEWNLHHVVAEDAVLFHRLWVGEASLRWACSAPHGGVCDLLAHLPPKW